MIRELLALLVETIRPRCVICGRRGCPTRDRCWRAYRSYADEALRKEGP